ncbi:hypothetical protein [Vibrio cholerae]|uniref:Uncharacterized protein n=1 Tax=Vibrio cholerae TaxID=666 RepID=A0ABD7SSK0_VIBCL|nr:hypothetical protein [Vibrio cholerae]TXX67306.1 hypothetical protein FXF03_01655 [Vibrio cholerae]TXY77994.1 hypothetical protein FXE80_01160 [Vibrio cholerae]GIA99167.1 hypothetical protein VCSRO136_2270 [Vibrio cholerae]GIB16791.1 hypothetical protein VCSRO90_2817 [Vibrio cholerae]
MINQSLTTLDVEAPTIPVIDVETGETSLYTLEEVLDLINRDRSADWTDYDESDWVEGWINFVEPEGCNRIPPEFIKAKLHELWGGKPLSVVRAAPYN